MRLMVLYSFQKFLLDITGDMPATFNTIAEFENEANRLGVEARANSDIIANAIPFLAPLVSEMFDWHHSKYGSGHKAIDQKTEYHERMVESFTKGWRDKDTETPTPNSIEDFLAKADQLGKELRTKSDSITESLRYLNPLVDEMFDWHRNRYGNSYDAVVQRTDYSEIMRTLFVKGWFGNDIFHTRTIEWFEEEAYKIGEKNKAAEPHTSKKFLNLYDEMQNWHRVKFSVDHVQANRIAYHSKLTQSFREGWLSAHSRTDDSNPTTIEEFHSAAYELGAEARKNNKPIATASSVEFNALLTKFSKNSAWKSVNHATRLMSKFGSGWTAEHQRITDEELKGTGFWEGVEADKRDIGFSDEVNDKRKPPDADPVERGFSWITADGSAKRFLRPEGVGGKIKLVVSVILENGTKRNDFYDTYSDLRKAIDEDIKKDLEQTKELKKSIEQSKDLKKGRLDYFSRIKDRTSHWYGFTSKMEPSKISTVAGILQKDHNISGFPVCPRKLMIENLVISNSFTVKRRDGERCLFSPSNKFFSEKDITKTGMDYAEYLSELGSKYAKEA